MLYVIIMDQTDRMHSFLGKTKGEGVVLESCSQKFLLRSQNEVIFTEEIVKNLQFEKFWVPPINRSFTSAPFAKSGYYMYRIHSN